MINVLDMFRQTARPEVCSIDCKYQHLIYPLSFTKKERVLRSPYYAANRLWEQLDHTVQNLNSVYDFFNSCKKVGFSQFKDIVKYV